MKRNQNSKFTTSCTTAIPGFDAFTFIGYSKFKDYYLFAEMQTKRWILRNLPTNGVFLDIGANVGILTVTAALKAKDGMVISLEPTDTIALLDANISSIRNQGANIRTLKFAASNFSGTRKETVYRIWGEKPETDIYDFRKIDDVVSDLNLKRIDVIKIDTDGWELEALKGATRTIEKFRPRLIVEINEALATRNVTQQDIMRFLIDHKYTDAQILDGGNFLFSSSWEAGMEWPNSINVSTDREAMKFNDRGELLVRFEKAENFQTERRIKVEATESNRIFSGAIEPWAFAVYFQLEKNNSLPNNLIITLIGELYEGDIGFAAINNDSSQFVSDEIVVNSPGKFEVSLTAFEFEEKLVLRPVSDSFFRVRVDEILIYACGPSTIHSEPNLDTIPIVEISDFFEILKVKPNGESLPELFPSDSGYLMEQTSAHFLKAFYRIFKPKKHLEIGTWEGFGSQLALSNGAGEVWSVEKYPDNNPEYGSRYFSDSHQTKPGWLVSAANRPNFHQIIGTSSDLFNHDFSPGFFDSILIDGAHDFESVKQDTEYALKITISGNVVLWDDFPIYISDNNSTRDGVLSAIKDLYTELNANFNLLAVKGTSILVGIRK